MIKLTTGTPGSGMTLHDCFPPVKKTESACALAVPVDSGQAGGTLSPLQRFAFVCQLRNPSGFWVRACDAEIMPRRYPELRRS